MRGGAGALPPQGLSGAGMVPLLRAGDIPVYPLPGRHSITVMDLRAIRDFLSRILRAEAGCVTLAILMPLLPAVVLGFSLSHTVALISTAFLIEYGAAPVGIVLGLPPLFVFYAIVCVEAGIFVGLFDLFTAVGTTSERVGQFLLMTTQAANRSKTLHRYGILALVPLEILIGVYLCAPVSWVMGWRRNISLAVTMSGYCIAAAITIFATIGLLNVFFP